MRIRPRAKTMRCITIANAKPMTSSTATVTTMISSVVSVLFQNWSSLRIVR